MKKILLIIEVIILTYFGFYIYENKDYLFDKVIDIYDKYFADKSEYILSKTNLKGIVEQGEIVNSDEISSLDDSGVEYENEFFNTTDNIYYSNLSLEEQKLYKQIYANIMAKETTFVVDGVVNKDDVPEIMESVLNDHPEIFWVENELSYRYNEDNLCKQIILKYNDAVNNIDGIQAQIDSAVNQIYNQTAGMSAYDKEKYVHDYLVDNLYYDETATDSQSIYSAFITKRTVCAGYARAFMYIMNKLNVRTYYVTGGMHAWNLILLDGEYYNVDVTWDDQPTGIIYNFFNRTDSEFQSTHTRSDLSLKLPLATGTRYAYKGKDYDPNVSYDIILEY